ncbi:uncharacterized protein MELLADRAFT_104591 [Melampsora larici-populina 98AG31]|uniref:Uncharacterized protein n=1 Tax=Melampsora larici-populina (strain 98AG31 / pathotype 3-4-7) TaxID=747676 RepID=F4RF84_MELLP|nr:uncharacterized protein MELLADRAFT_104591 [Melampsora larici-populina 98AG31]EGG08767.1 hypothetical protein MELLADRAFT_104591 [Melampsora larici-populina 98AG31]
MTWTDHLSKAVKLSIRRIHQLAKGINPLTISAHSVVAAQPKYDTSTSDGPQDYATPFPDSEQYLFGVKAHQNGIDTCPDYTGHHLSLMEPSWIQSFGDVLPELEDHIPDDTDSMPWSNGLLIALVAQSDDSSLDPSPKNLKFGQWWLLNTIQVKDGLLTGYTTQPNNSKAKPEHEKSNVHEEDAGNKTSKSEEDALETWCN